MICRIVPALAAVLVVSSVLPAAEQPVQAPVPSGNPAADVQDLVFFGQDRPVFFRLHVRLDGKSFRAAWDEHLTTFFKELDRDGDGVLDVDEAQRIDEQNVVPEKSFFEKLFSLRKDELPNLPADGIPRDGKVTRDELAAYFRRSRRGPFATQVDARGRRNTNDQSPGRKLLSRLDTDENDALSPEELEAAAAALREFDVNDDETISLSELTVQRNVYYARSSFSSYSGQNVFVPFKPGENLDRLAGRVLRRYAGETDEEKNAEKPRALSRRELGWQADVFDRFDADASGGLDAEELRRFLQRPVPAVELLVLRGKLPDDAETTKQPERRLQLVKIDKSTAPGLAVRELAKHVIGFDLGRDRIVLATDASGDSARSNTKSIYENQFNFADTDNNDYLEQNEVDRNFYFRNSFKQMDADGDGKLFKKEMAAWLQRQVAAARSRTAMNVVDREHDLFELLDADSDRQLGLREAMTASQRLLECDRDGDGTVKLNELPRQYKVAVTQGQAGIQGAPVQAAGLSARRSSTSKGPRWFRKMDVNNDGDVSSREFLGPRDHFRRMDADGDRLIDPKEASRFD